MQEEKIDVSEDRLLSKFPSVLKKLLLDKSTGKNIIWASEYYCGQYGDGFRFDDQIFPEIITGIFCNVIQPRIFKEKQNQTKRTKSIAEVFTPAWICNKQINLIDDDWFGRKGVFNVECGRSWKTNYETIKFSAEHSWQEYVDACRLEFTCGEAPYLVSRYDNATGNIIALKDRIGMFDRKLRVVKENCSSEKEWHHWSKRAFKSSYGFEFLGDSLLLARENLLYTYADYLRDFLNREPRRGELEAIANIISWNMALPNFMWSRTKVLFAFYPHFAI